MRKRPTVTPDRDWVPCAEFATGDGDSAIGISRTSKSAFDAKRSLQLGILLLGWLAKLCRFWHRMVSIESDTKTDNRVDVLQQFFSPDPNLLNGAQLKCPALGGKSLLRVNWRTSAPTEKPDRLDSTISRLCTCELLCYLAHHPSLPQSEVSGGQSRSTTHRLTPRDEA